MPARTSTRYCTITLDSDGRLVPWLAAQGPLSYTPEAPPPRDNLFQYGWVLPQVCRPDNRRHLYFGARERAQELFAFWENARRKGADRVALKYGKVVNGGVEAPIAVYRHRTRLLEDQYVFIQHGSFQCVPVDEQPELEDGYVLLHRGIGETKTFRFPAPLPMSAAQPVREASRYYELLFELLSRSDLSFNSIHDRTKRAETSQIRDDTWVTDELAAQRGLDIERDATTRALWNAAHQSFALRSWVSEHKFGPNRVVIRTLLSNIRITTFFAGEHEARLVDPTRLELVDAVGCRVLWEG